MNNPWLRWLPVLLVSVGWTLVWALAWQSYLYEAFAREPGPGLILFDSKAADLRFLSIIAVAAVVLAGIGYFLLVQSSVLRSHSRPAGVILRSVGALLVIVALSLTILFPAAHNVVVDQERRAVSLEGRWLYTREVQAIRFDEILRVSLRVQRRTVPSGTGCQIATGLSIVRLDGNWLDIPGGFDHESMAPEIAEAVNVPLDANEVRQC